MDEQGVDEQSLWGGSFETGRLLRRHPLRPSGPRGEMRLLEVEVVEAEGLFPANASGTDAYAEIKLFDLVNREIKKEHEKTRTISGGVAPRWLERFTFGKNYDLSHSDHLPKVRVRVYYDRLMAHTCIGVVTIDLEAAEAAGVELDAWYDLGADKLVTKGPKGRIRLKVRFVSDDDAGAASRTDDAPFPVGPLGDGPPNELWVRVLRARHLRVMDSRTLLGAGGSSDPFTTVKVGEEMHRTRTVKKSLEPHWNETFTFVVSSADAYLDVDVYDEDRVSNELMGRATLPLAHLDDGVCRRMWCKLLTKGGGAAAGGLGDVEVMVQWVCDARRVSATPKVSGFTRLFRKAEAETDSDSEHDADDDPQTRAEAELRAETDAAASARLGSELDEMSVKSGDYQIQVHIIEARDLKAKDYEGTSDPVVFVEAFGTKVSTRIHNKCLSCVFDELFIINKRDLDKDAFKEGAIRVTVMDADTLTRNDTIGAYVVDAAYVYFQEHHEMHRAWVALVNDEDPLDDGVCGYLKLSIQVVGPGDKVYIHDEREDRLREKKEDMRADGGISAMVIMPPALKREQQWLVTTLWRAEYLPVMDLGLVTTGGIDAFAQVEFGTMKRPLRTPVVHLKGARQKLVPEWRTELWVPLSVPTGTQTVKYTVWDYEATTKNELVATFYDRFGAISAAPEGRRPPHWCNLYGAAVDNGLLDSTKSALRAVGAKAGAKVDWKEFYNLYPAHASTYRGRVLVSQRVLARDAQPEKYRIGKQSVGFHPFRRKCKRLDRKREPPTRPYSLQCIVVAGVELPKFRTLAGGVSRLQLNVSWGRHDMLSAHKPNNNGATEWHELLSGLAEDMPVDAEQCPDVFLYLSKGEATSAGRAPACSFVRLKAADLLAQGFTAGPRWITLQEDKGLNMLDVGNFPGAVLVQLGLGGPADWAAAERAWHRDVREMTHRTPYRLRCHLFQARELQVESDTVDSYLQVNFNGMEPVKTDYVRDSADPTYYRTVEFDCALPRLKYAPQVFVQVWDRNYVVEDAYIGCFYVDLFKEATVTDLDRKAPRQPFPDPKWHALVRERPGDCDGAVLASFELIPKSTPDQNLDVPPSLKPQCRPAVIDIIAVGLRGLVPFQMVDIQQPFLTIEYAGSAAAGTDRVVQKTAPSKSPSPQDPNFLQRIRLEVELPVNAVFAAPIKLVARDTRLGGFVKPIVGRGVIPLVDKIPWSENFKAAVDLREAAALIASDATADAAAVANDDAAATPPPAAPPADGTAAADGAAAADVSSNDVENPLVGRAHVPHEALDALVKARVPQQDDGAGVFGALLHVKQQELASERRVTKRKKGLSRLLGDAGDEGAENSGDEEYEESEPAWAKDRRSLESDLEEELKGAPFETYDLFLGSKLGSLFKDADYRVTGLFKGIVRVLLPGEPDAAELDLEELLKPRGARVRLYVTRGLGLAPMDVGFAGRPGKSDPYLKCSLGKHVFNDRQNKIDDATDVDLYKCIEFNTELPGASRLVIDMMDYDQIGLSDDLIGGTIVDLEDRWFLPQWRALGEDLRSDALGAVRGAVKPLERRALYARSCKAPQGTLECWVDILTPAEAAAYPADDIALPPRMPAEIRIVVWKAREMVSMDSITHMNDLFVKCWLTDAVPQCTDIHWRAKSGKGSFNWRMKFDVDLGHNAKIIKFPHLHVQAWDQDILKWNDLIAESAIDLGRSLRKAYFFGEEVTLFRGMGGSQKAKKKQAAGEPENGESGGLIAAADAPAPREEEQLLRDGAANGNVSSKKKKGKVQQIKRKTGMCWRALGACCRLCCGRGKQAEATGADTKDAAKAELEDEDTSAFVTQFKDMTGWGDSDPADSSWLYMDKLDHETGVREPMGRICLSIRVLPKRVAVVSPAGFGRSAPNQHPYLPPPTGRLYFSLNPFIMGSQLCGPKICAQLTSCLICIAVILLAVFCQPALNALVFLLCNNFR